MSPLVGVAIVIGLVVVFAVMALVFTPKGNLVEEPMVKQRNELIRQGKINPNRRRQHSE